MTIADLKIPFVVVAVLSLIAILPLPYGYYTFLRIAVTLCACTATYIFHKNNNKDWIMWACVAVAIVFNPIIPVHLTKEIWMFLNLLVAGLFGYLGYKSYNLKQTEKENS